MQLIIAAVGRAKASPERDLTDTFLTRIRGTGPGLGFGSITLAEVEERKRLEGAQLKAREAELLLAAVPAGGVVIALDERGKDMPSSAFAEMLGTARDGGAPALAFLIGGADGHGPEVRQQAAKVLSFGRATWPHMMVRAMLAEQIYRGLTILSGHPYHREG